MTTLSLYGGPLKRDIIKQAYGLCGQSVAEYELEPEEYEAGLRCMTNAVAELEDAEGIVLGFNYPVNGGYGSPQDESGIPRGSVRAVAAIVAKALAPEIGKTLSTQATGAYAKALDNLRSSYMTVPQMQLGRQTITGAGNRRRWFGPFFMTDADQGEIDVTNNGIVVTNG